MFRELGIGENLFAEFQSISVLLVFITSLRTYERKNLNTKHKKQTKKRDQVFKLRKCTIIIIIIILNSGRNTSQIFG